MSFQINWAGDNFGEIVNVYQELKDHELYQKWSIKTVGEILSAKSDLVTDIAKITANKDSVYILDYLSWLGRMTVILIDLTA